MIEDNERKPIEVLNPAYRGTTPKDVGRALLRRVENRQEDDREKPTPDGEFQSSI